MVSDPETTPAKRTWLTKVARDAEKEWEKRTHDHDRKINWEE